jgi:predicted Zn finger-like uncharacterized protein
MSQRLIRCPACGKNYRVDESRLGREVACAKCKKQFVLSDGSETESQGEPIEVDETMGVQSPAESTDEQSQLPAPSIAPDSTVAENRFDILKELGSGAFGVVYKALDKRLDRVVALKVPRIGSLGSEGDAQRFLREARAAGNLQHPNIVPIYDAGEHDGSYFIASGFVEGDTLETVLRDRKMSPQKSATIIGKLAAALSYAHGEGIVHRDVKPGNVLLDKHGEPMLMDFGMARRKEGEALRTQEGARLGTPAYMSPEQHAGQSHLADARSDQWALGVMLYEMLTGKRPFRAHDARQLAYQVRETEPESPRRHRKTVDRDLETICLKCLEKAPSNRYASCGALASELNRWSRGKPILARPVGIVERSYRWGKRNPAWVGVSAMAVVLVILVAGLFFWSGTPDAEFRLEPIEDQRVLVKNEIVFHARLTDPKAWKNRVKYELVEGDASGAEIDPESGRLQFFGRSPGACQIRVRAIKLQDTSQFDEVSFQLTVLEPIQAPKLRPVSPQVAAPGDEVRFMATVTNRDTLPCPCRFDLTGTVPPGAKIDRMTGEFTWKVPLNQQACHIPIYIQAAVDWPGEPSSTTAFDLQVLGGNDLLFVESTDDLAAKPGEELLYTVHARDRRPAPRKLSFRLIDAPEGASIDAESGEFSWTPTAEQGGRSYDFRVCVNTALPVPLEQVVPLHISVEAPSFAVVTNSK